MGITIETPETFMRLAYFLSVAAMLMFCFETQANGALAIDGNQGTRYGFSYNHPNLASAQNRALQECGSGCYVVNTFARGCAAYAADQTSGSTVYGWGTAANKNQAQSTALNFCRNQGGANCIIRAWGCNSN